MWREFWKFALSSWREWQEHCWGDCSPKVELFGIFVSQNLMREVVALMMENTRALAIPRSMMMQSTHRNYADAKNAEREFFRKLYPSRR